MVDMNTPDSDTSKKQRTSKSGRKIKGRGAVVCISIVVRVASFEKN